MSLDAILAAMLFAVGLGFLAASVGILYRHAIPRAPRFFQAATVAPGVVVGLSALVLAWMFLTGLQDIAPVAGVFVGALAAWIWTMNLYAAFFYVTGRNQSGHRRVK